MKKKSPIKITLKHVPSGPLSGGLSTYTVKQIAHAITIDTDDRVNIHVGELLAEQEAEQLNRHYQVTVVQ